MHKSANKVLKNTTLLYAKMFISVGISLYSTRLILYALGESDFGIYNLVAGVVAMLSFLNGAMTMSTQRYLSFYQTNGGLSMQRKIFSSSLVIHIILAVLLSILTILAGSFLFGGLLNIPINRLYAAKLMYIFMILSISMSIISVPFVSSIIAHEDMKWIAIIDTIEIILKLLATLYIAYGIIFIDRLILYAASISIIGAITLFLYILISSKYKECSLKIKKEEINKNILLELTSFASWNLFGALCGIGRTQGLAVVLNVFLGTIANAAYGISNQVSGQMSFFSVTMMRALNPQIMKSEGDNDRFRMIKLSMIGCKFGFFLLAVIAVPCISTMNSLLSMWLTDIPKNTVVFCQLTLIAIMINQLTIGVQSSFQAVGKIKLYQSIVGSLLLLNLPVAYFLLKNGYPAYSIIISYIIIEFLACIIRLYLGKKIIGISINVYAHNVIYPIFKSTIPIIIVIYILSEYIYSILLIQGFLLTTLFIIAIILIYSTFIWFFGLNNEEKEYINKIVIKLKNYGK